MYLLVPVVEFLVGVVDRPNREGGDGDDHSGHDHPIVHFASPGVRVHFEFGSYHHAMRDDGLSALLRSLAGTALRRPKVDLGPCLTGC